MALVSRLVLGALIASALTACGEREEAPAERAAAPAAGEVAAPPAAPPATEQTAVAEHVPPGNRSPETLWRLYCVECHAPGEGHPGTMMLSAKKGDAQAVILGREDLSAEYIAATVRGGLLEMTPFRPTEITDEELTALAEYVRSTAADAAPADLGG
jgi:mono/diheme cytochrome c family protein